MLSDSKSRIQDVFQGRTLPDIGLNIASVTVRQGKIHFLMEEVQNNNHNNDNDVIAQKLAELGILNGLQVNVNDFIIDAIYTHCTASLQ